MVGHSRSQHPGSGHRGHPWVVARAHGRVRHRLLRALPEQGPWHRGPRRRRDAPRALHRLQHVPPRDLCALCRPTHRGRGDPDAHARRGHGRARSVRGHGREGGEPPRRRAPADRRARRHLALAHAGPVALVRHLRPRQRPRLRPRVAALRRPRLRRHLPRWPRRPRPVHLHVDQQLRLQPRRVLRRADEPAVQVAVHGRGHPPFPDSQLRLSRVRCRVGIEPAHRPRRALGEAQPLGAAGAPRSGPGRLRRARAADARLWRRPVGQGPRRRRGRSRSGPPGGRCRTAASRRVPLHRHRDQDRHPRSVRASLLLRLRGRRSGHRVRLLEGQRLRGTAAAHLQLGPGPLGRGGHERRRRRSPRAGAQGPAHRCRFRRLHLPQPATTVHPGQRRVLRRHGGRGRGAALRSESRQPRPPEGSQAKSRRSRPGRTSGRSAPSRRMAVPATQTCSMPVLCATSRSAPAGKSATR